MSKGEVTREHIIAEAAMLFNKHGFSGTPLSELMEATGLKKGGIYNHFSNKEEILISAFEYSMELLLERISAVVNTEATARGKMDAILEFYRSYPLEPVVVGGCPILNAIVDSDNSNHSLRSHVQAAVGKLTRRLAAILIAGIRNGEYHKRLEPHMTASMMLASIEGGVALSRNADDNRHMEIVIEHLRDYLAAFVVP